MLGAAGYLVELKLWLALRHAWWLCYFKHSRVSWFILNVANAELSIGV